MRISIIIPVYNNEAYIERCLESLTGQTYNDIEIVVIDDGSEDQTGNILKRIGKTEDRLKLIFQENQGPSVARNKGLDACSGDLVTFVDSDDYLEKDALEKLAANFDDDVDAVFFPFIKEYPSKNIVTELFPGKRITFENSDVREYLLRKLIGPVSDNGPIKPLEMDRLNTCWGKVYRKTILKDIRFVDTKIIWLEDGWFNIQAMYNVKQKIVYTSETYYHYNKSNMLSFLHTFKENYFSRRLNVYKRMEHFITVNGMDGNLVNLANRIMLDRFSILLYISQADYSFKRRCKEIKRVLRYRGYEKWKDKAEISDMGWVWKSYYFLCDHNQWLLLAIFFEIVRCYSLLKSQI